MVVSVIAHQLQMAESGKVLVFEPEVHGIISDFVHVYVGKTYSNW